MRSGRLDFLASSCPAGPSCNATATVSFANEGSIVDDRQFRPRRGRVTFDPINGVTPEPWRPIAHKFHHKRVVCVLPG
jgi:hypothetical protein